MLRGAATARACALTRDGAREIARRARGTPRVATRLLRRVRDFATVDGNGRRSTPRSPTARCASSRSTSSAWTAWTAATCGCIAVNYGGGPVGIDTMAAALSEQRDTLEEMVEPFLLQQGLLQRTPRGRLLTRIAWQHLGLSRRATPARRSACSTMLRRPDRGR